MNYKTTIFHSFLDVTEHTCEVLALWKILCEHQFNLLFTALLPEEQNILAACTFRDLILSRADTCALLIVSLVDSYLNDNTTVSSISSKLRDVCPNLYRHEHAVLYKATELLLLSKSCVDREERQEKLHMALQLCKDAAPDIPLTNICQQFTQANYYQGVIQLCATCASLKDPNNAALHFYMNNEPLEDQEGFAAYNARMNYYKEIKSMLDHIYQSHCLQKQNALANQTATGATEHESNLNNTVLQTIALVLQISDQLLHITIYEWLLSHNFLSELLNISNPSLGDFLMRSVLKAPENNQLADILWKYYERNGQHAAATKILDKLASSPNANLLLSERIEYLARAVMCMRSDNVGYATSNGISLKDIEDKLEIARVQKMILDTLSSQPNHDAKMACKSLNYQLYTINQLYGDFVERFDLCECKLKILHCSHHNDPLLIESVWTELINNELASGGSADEKITRLLLKMQTLSKEYGTSGHCFPLAFLVHELELRCCKLRLHRSPVPEALIDGMGIDIDLLLDIYSRMISMNERTWANEGNEWHLVQSATQLVDMLTTQTHLIPVRNRTRIVAKAQELASACRNLLYPKPNTERMQNQLHDIEAKLKRILY